MSPYRETDPDIVEEKLIQTVEDFPTFSRAQFSDWLFRLRMLPKESRKRIWIHLSKRMPYQSLKVLRDYYKRMLSPDWRERK